MKTSAYLKALILNCLQTDRQLFKAVAKVIKEGTVGFNRLSDEAYLVYISKLIDIAKSDNPNFSNTPVGIPHMQWRYVITKLNSLTAVIIRSLIERGTFVTGYFQSQSDLDNAVIDYGRAIVHGQSLFGILPQIQQMTDEIPLVPDRQLFQLNHDSNQGYKYHLQKDDESAFEARYEFHYPVPDASTLPRLRTALEAEVPRAQAREAARVKSLHYNRSKRIIEHLLTEAAQHYIKKPAETRPQRTLAQVQAKFGRFCDIQGQYPRIQLTLKETTDIPEVVFNQMMARFEKDRVFSSRSIDIIVNLLDDPSKRHMESLHLMGSKVSRKPAVFIQQMRTERYIALREEVVDKSALPRLFKDEAVIQVIAEAAIAYYQTRLQRLPWPRAKASLVAKFGDYCRFDQPARGSNRPIVQSMEQYTNINALSLLTLMTKFELERGISSDSKKCLRAAMTRHGFHYDENAQVILLPPPRQATGQERERITHKLANATMAARLGYIPLERNLARSRTKVLISAMTHYMNASDSLIDNSDKDLFKKLNQMHRKQFSHSQEREQQYLVTRRVKTVSGKTFIQILPGRHFPVTSTQFIYFINALKETRFSFGQRFMAGPSRLEREIISKLLKLSDPTRDRDTHLRILSDLLAKPRLTRADVQDISLLQPAIQSTLLPTTPRQRRTTLSPRPAAGPG